MMMAAGKDGMVIITSMLFIAIKEMEQDSAGDALLCWSGWAEATTPL